VGRSNIIDLGVGITDFAATLRDTPGEVWPTMFEMTHHDSIAIMRMANGKANATGEFCELLSARFGELPAASPWTPMR
jgi:hypothetical protein